MKTTLEIPDHLFRQAKALAATQGLSMKSLVSEALEARLSISSPTQQPWMRHFGSLRHLGAERTEVEGRIREEFETVDPSAWD